LALAQYNLGLAYQTGRGVGLSYEQAAEWYGKAAEQDLVEAAQALGMLYDLGKGVPKDPRRASAWYRRAAEAGDPVARYIVGVRYLEGNGVAREPLKAYLWLSLAVAGGIEHAAGPRDEAAAAISPKEIEAALGLSRPAAAAK